MISALTWIAAGLAIPLFCVLAIGIGVLIRFIGHAIAANARQRQPGEVMLWPDDDEVAS